MQPMPLVPWKTREVRIEAGTDGVFSMEWISFWNPPVPSQNTMPARRVPRCE